MAPGKDTLNEHQARRLRITCQYADELLSDLEGILNESASKIAFPRYISDIAPAQRRIIEDYTARIRAQLVRVLDGQGIPREPSSIPASRAIAVTLVSLDISVEELKPKYMRGYGDVSEVTATELNGIVGELHGLITRLDRYLAEGVGQDLKGRLQHLEQAGNDLQLLSRIEQVVADRGLVEFRGTIGSILDRAEDRTFEIAVFGRVSSGKSSLLNAVLGTPVLPVGVTPITAVPTRIAYGEKPSITVSFAESPAKSYEITRLGDFATEQQNPGNVKHVTRIVVTLPASRLGEGVTLVDTPGLGSLATSGAAETLAYLPKCDLGVVLIDAGSTLTAGDLQTILALQEAAIPVNVLLSKADLLSPDDCEKTVHYVKQHIALDCSLELPVHPISVLPSHVHLLNRWFEEHILPLFSRSQDLKALSLQRKIGALRESVISALQIQILRSQHSLPGTHEEIRAVEARLRQATGLIEETRAACEREAKEMAGAIPEIFQETSTRVTEGGFQDANPGMATDVVIRTSILKFVQEKAKRIQDLVGTLALQLQNDLRASAKDLGIADMPGEDEFQSLVRDMPVFDLGTISASVSRSTYAALFGRRFAENQLANRIRQQLGEPFGQALASYSGVLKEWSRLVTGQLGRRFETYAERYRAQAERSFRGHDLSVDEIRAIEEDRRLLGGTRSVAETSVTGV